LTNSKSSHNFIKEAKRIILFKLKILEYGGQEIERIFENSYLKFLYTFLLFYLSRTPSALDHRSHVLGILLFICQETDVAAHVEHPGLRGLHRPSNPFRTLQQCMPSRIPPCQDNREISETISHRISTLSSPFNVSPLKKPEIERKKERDLHVLI